MSIVPIEAQTSPEVGFGLCAGFHKLQSHCRTRMLCYGQAGRAFLDKRRWPSSSSQTKRQHECSHPPTVLHFRLSPPTLLPGGLFHAYVSFAFTIGKPCLVQSPIMAQVIHFPLRLRTALIRSMVDDLEAMHGVKADQFWRTRIAAIVDELRSMGLPSAEIRTEILDLHHAIQDELMARSKHSAAGTY